MKFSLLTAVVVALAADGVVASSWFGKAAYNKWHETELERWLSDHNVPYPAASDRKDLIDLVNKNWEENIARPYSSWDVNQLTRYLTGQGQKVEQSAENNKDSLVGQVKKSWTETTEQASDAYNSVSGWFFDSWTDSQIKAYLDYHNIPNPSPRNRDSLLTAARSNYQSVATKIGETAAYPGNWIYQSWSESDLKAWLDERGVPIPQPSSRDKLIASVRRNSRYASNKAAKASSSASASAYSAKASLTNQLINAWDETSLKKWADENGVSIPQGSNLNEMRAFVRRQSAQLTGGNLSKSAASAYGAATTSAGNFYVQATNDIYSQGKQWYDWAAVRVGMGSEQAKSSMSSISSAASSFSSSVSSVAEKSASSASKSAVKSSADGAAAAKSARAEVTKSAASASKVAAASARSLTAKAKNEL